MLVQVRPAHPSAQIADLERAIDGLFQRVWRSQSPVFSRGHSPFALARDADGVTLRAEIPGVEPDAIDIRVEGRKLAMHAERKPDAREGAVQLVRERAYGRIAHALQLSDDLTRTRDRREPQRSAHRAHTQARPGQAAADRRRGRLRLCAARDMHQRRAHHHAQRSDR